jgi:ABC-type multidrug transport system fused ATPase/permease subunit
MKNIFIILPILGSFIFFTHSQNSQIDTVQDKANVTIKFVEKVLNENIESVKIIKNLNTGKFEIIDIRLGDGTILKQNEIHKINESMVTNNPNTPGP